MCSTPAAVYGSVASMSTLRNITGKVVDCSQETADTWTLHIDVAAADRQYEAGQFISIDPHQFSVLDNWIAYLQHCKGRREQVRAYSMASAPHEPYVSITIKPEIYEPEQNSYPPLMSGLLASDWLQGRLITFKGYTGAYTLRYLNDNRYAHVDTVIHLTAGSGIVPNFALLKDALHHNKQPHVRHVLVDVNKTVQDIIFHEQLNKLAQQYPQRLQLLHVLTRQQNVQQCAANTCANVTYQTCWHDSCLINATGVIMLPRNFEEPMPMLAWDHGTRIKKARSFGVRGEEAIGAFFDPIFLSF